MPDVHGKGSAGAAPAIAIGAAIVALLTSLIAVIVVVSRGGEAPGVAAADGSSREAKADAAPPLPRAQRVAASDVVRLRRESVTLARDAGKVIGVKVTDDDLRKALELEADDVITALAGRTIERELDVFEAMFALKRLRASRVYVELLRDGHPLLVVWKVDGDLQTARAPDGYGVGGSLGGGGLGGLGGSTGGLLGPDPYSPAPDPLADTIKKIDDLAYEVPRSTVERVFAAPSAYARSARTLPSRRTTGFQVFGVRPSSIVAAIGIQSGDTIRAINGHAVTSTEEVGELYPQIKDAKEWRIDLHRRSRPILITIAIK